MHFLAGTYTLNLYFFIKIKKQILASILVGTFAISSACMEFV
ncbi:hypothetical protein [Campylobacter concisus]|nr:hypothetical protein [Campylobacter concisus]